uniref:Uncharacterized protein n=1 Tax=Candidatus Kentrum sp. DK TaxID=2126562 RepID=A0A450SS86_9GAMM|nr:MAG: hypothetical protein BECKDK2373B_GA0170837_10627 [Candidatus Kentron sp. DK]
MLFYQMNRGNRHFSDSAIFFMLLEMYAKRTLCSLTALKMASKRSFTLCKLRFFDHSCLVMKHNSSFAVASLVNK